MSKPISRRAWLTSVPALGSLLLTGCSRETFVPPRVRGGLIGAADVLTMSTNRLLLSGQQLAREYPRSEIADPFPTWNQTNPRNEEYQQHLSEGFRNWRLPVTGLVQRPRELSLDEIKSLPARTQITAHVCEQGWSAIGEWTGAPLQRLLEAAGGVLPAARYVVIHTFDRWYQGYDYSRSSIRRRSWLTDSTDATFREATARHSVSAWNDSADTRTSNSCDRFRWSTRWPALAGARVEPTRTSDSTGSLGSRANMELSANVQPRGRHCCRPLAMTNVSAGIAPEVFCHK